MTELPVPGDPAGWLILFGEHHQHRCLVLERAAAELKATQLHRGVVFPVVIGGPAEVYGLDQDAD